MTVRRKLELWTAIAAMVVILCLLTMRWVDLPVATLFQDNILHNDLLSRGLGSAVLVSGELAVIAALAGSRITGHALSPFGRTALIACCVSLCTFTGNDHVLKALFGRPDPSHVLIGHMTPGFHFFHGSFRSGFPSGHMAMATSFAMVMMRGVPRLIPWAAALLAVAAVVLVAGDWHFVSDVIAGTFIGALAGFWAWELWHAHMCHWGGAEP